MPLGNKVTETTYSFIHLIRCFGVVFFVSVQTTKQMKTSQHKSKVDAVTLWSTQSSINGMTEMDARHEGLENIKSINGGGTRRSKIDF